jgi:hypothetical protein
MKYKVNDVLVWDSDDGVLIRGKKYVVCKIKNAGQDFSIEGIEPVIWWLAGEPFRLIAPKEEK